jgi:hypothetical protein
MSPCPEVLTYLAQTIKPILFHMTSLKIHFAMHMAFHSEGTIMVGTKFFLKPLLLFNCSISSVVRR